ncbi:TrkH family potassium uptake protein [Sesbania bispinosa]|nr:TrkH family potassium uptake protein [Sesbania bispinosa]
MTLGNWVGQLEQRMEKGDGKRQLSVVSKEIIVTDSHQTLKNFIRLLAAGWLRCVTVFHSEGESDTAVVVFDISSEFLLSPYTRISHSLFY